LWVSTQWLQWQAHLPYVHLLVQFAAPLPAMEEERGQGGSEREDAIEHDRTVHV